MIHRFKQNGVNIVLDVNSGSVHVMDELAFEIAGLVEENESISNEEIIDKLINRFSMNADFKNNAQTAIYELRQLMKDGKLFSRDSLIDYRPKKQSVVKALCLHIAHDCNLRCKYCFAGEGRYHSERSLMTAETGKQALDFLVKHSGNRRNLEVDFFGGEPTINFNTVKEIVEHGHGLEKIHNKRFRFTLTTNAFSITDELIDYANENMTNVVLSIDGRKETNDRMRVDASGKGSYDRILSNILKFAETRNGENYYVRGTFTRHNLDFSEDVKHLYQQGFNQISIEPVVAPPDRDYSIREEDVPVLMAEYENLAEIVFENDDLNFFHFNIDLTGGACVLKRISGCGAGCEYLAVTPSGDLYPCHQFVGEESFKLGSVRSEIEKTSLSEEFDSLNVYSKQSCKACWAKYYCSGGCAANAYHYGGSIFSEYEIGCVLQKKRIECALYIKAKKAVSRRY